jgi:hypothetical protein
MEEGDHTDCPVELLACPAHQEEERKQMVCIPRQVERDATMLVQEPQAVPLMGAVLAWLASWDQRHK